MELKDLKWRKQAEAELPDDPTSLRLINQQLWCCCYDAGIEVLEHEELTKADVVPAGDTGWVCDVAAFRDDVVIAAGTGLYHTDVNGKHGFLVDPTTYSST